MGKGWKHTFGLILAALIAASLSCSNLERQGDVPFVKFNPVASTDAGVALFSAQTETRRAAAIPLSPTAELNGWDLLLLLAVSAFAWAVLALVVGFVCYGLAAASEIATAWLICV